MFNWFERLIFGKPRNINDPGVFHKISLVAFLAWVGLGADGLSSSTYGPEETFRMLGSHPHLAVILALAMIFTIAIISYAYSRIIEHFPIGGGGYVIATTLLGPKAGLISGSALLVDYALTISVSVAAASDAFFSFFPVEYQALKLPAAFIAILGLVVLNLRGTKESVTVLMPVFLLFLLTHAAIILGAVLIKLGSLPEVAQKIHHGFQSDISTIGWMGIAALCLRAYSMGCGTYTGIEAVSNGLAIMREPKVETGKKTMFYMATSLAITAAGLILAYLLFNIEPTEGRTMNAGLAYRFIETLGGSGIGGWGRWFIFGTLFAEAALLVVAAQAGFIDGPRVMANMALDSWLPRRLASLSDRLTIQDGILLMSIASLGTLLYAKGNTATLVLMYSINVFVTFTLSEMSMIRFWLAHSAKYKDWKKKISIHIVGFVLCLTILTINLYEKFFEGGWMTLALTLSLISLCALIKNHYNQVRQNLSRLDAILTNLPEIPGKTVPALNPKEPTAVLMVGGYGGLGIHALLTIQRLFPNYFKNFVFVSVGVVDSAVFKEVGVVDDVRDKTAALLNQYMDVARRVGVAATSRMGISTDVMEEAEKICLKITKEYPRIIVFAGKLIFQKENLFNRVLHNDTAYGLQRRLQFAGLNSMVLPVRVLSQPEPTAKRGSMIARRLTGVLAGVKNQSSRLLLLEKNEPAS
ncbi:MAG: amino acid permease [Elusimicrobia bacterium]|nr:amino acid permease [Elusimicrobiota bacterium]